MTPAQETFFLGYGPEFLQEELPARLELTSPRYVAARKAFVARANTFSFDGQATPGQIRTAKALAAKGYLQSAQAHGVGARPDHLEVVFSSKGAGTLFDLWTTRHLKAAWLVYLLECQDGSFYAGVSDDLLARWQAHCEGAGAKYTRSHPPKRVLAYRLCEDRSAALKLEHAIKQMPKTQKLQALQCRA